MECFACIHCHFYQPPRENPWLEAVEAQDSAAPYHDWNQRVARECYLPNGASRILNGEGRIRRIVNNYARISFNFGPTLLAWMEEKEPEAYQRILDGDRESLRRFSGHGSALAQAYNHTILPLANSRDKQTQILWGIKDFQRRFGRDPAGMWLPETAVDLETLEILSAEGIRFTILAPRQAKTLRISSDSGWIDLQYGIDSRRAYVCNLQSGRSIGLFFYDGGLATAVAFERLLFSGENFARRLLSRFDPAGDSGQLMHIATDGESYGHHHAHGDMALAYALNYLEENKLARLTNYGEYFALCPPTHEVQIHEKSSWSCAHGISRWERNCGCNSGGHPQWTQEWRRPLREAFDWLRDELSGAYAKEAKKFFKKPWAARDNYIAVVLDRASVLLFFAKHCVRPLSADEAVRALRLLEMQRHLMLMYTSCGWFFDEPTGPETIQVLQYAARAVQLGQQLFGGNWEDQFLERLDSLHSNIPEFGNGRKIYEKFVRPAMLDLPGVAAHYAISSFFEGYQPSAGIYSYRADLTEVEKFDKGLLKLAAGRARITSQITEAQLDFNFVVVYSGAHNLSAGIAPLHEEFGSFIERIKVHPDSGFAEYVRLLDAQFGANVYSLRSLFHDERRKILGKIVDATLSNLDGLYRDVYEHNNGLIGFLRELALPMPVILQVSSEFVLQNAIRRSLADEKIDFDQLRMLLETSRREMINLGPDIKAESRTRLNRVMNHWARNPLEMKSLREVERLVFALSQMDFESDLWEAQNIYYTITECICSLPHLSLSSLQMCAEWMGAFRSVGERLGISIPQQFLAELTQSEQEKGDLTFGSASDAAEYSLRPDTSGQLGCVPAVNGD